MHRDERRRVVADAYNELGAGFGEWSARMEGEPLERFVGELAARLPEGSRLLDLGCGDGRRTALLAEHFDVVGVEISHEQLSLARAALPGVRLLEADILELAFPPESFDGITALYSLMHLPREEHPALLARIRHWLRPGGLFLAPMSTQGGPDRVETWLGVEMFFSGWDAATNRRLVREAGFDVLVDEVIEVRESAADYTTAFLWMLARR